MKPVFHLPHLPAGRGLLVLLVLGGALSYWLYQELDGSALQARYFSSVARDATFAVQPGASAAIRFPTPGGPYDQRLGYSGLPRFVPALQKQGFAITRQAVQSDAMLDLADHGLTAPLLPLGLNLPYAEKDQAGLTVLDGRGQPLYQARSPQRVYADFQAIPPLLVASLLYIENQSLLREDEPQRNPTIEWGRLGVAVVNKAVHAFTPGYRAAGASTLATQIEKYRHSPGGRTGSEEEKLRQMLSASVRAYLHGEETLPARRQLVLHYLNTVPLSARSGLGEVAGIGDGMWAWYGRSFAEVNRALADKSPVALSERALLFKEALSLMIAQRSPSYYLFEDINVLQALTDNYLQLMARDGLISASLLQAALSVSLQQERSRGGRTLAAPAELKGANSVRLRLASLLGINRMYDLDQLDVTASSTLDATLQKEVTAALRQLRDPAYARAAGLMDFRLLQQGAPEGVTYSFTLLERTPQGNKVRVQADNFDQPFDINDGAKLDLGSTAKLRTLVTYLKVISDLHAHFAVQDAAALAKAAEQPDLPLLTRWAIDYLRNNEDHSLTAMLQAAMAREYAANPEEQFYTGGGLHSFVNFDKEDNSKVMSVSEATQRSVNLVYIRLMRDIAHYFESPVGLQSSPPDDRAYLQRFADQEGRAFLLQFYQQYRRKPLYELDAQLGQRFAGNYRHLALIHRTLQPQSTFELYADYVRQHYRGSEAPSQKTLLRLYADYSAGQLSLDDRGYLLKMHPLELWLLAYWHQHPGAKWQELELASKPARQQAYSWLFKRYEREPLAVSSRLRQMREQDAFARIHAQWREMGYPFERLVPSYATALGASADRPAALAEMMGILSADGMHLPTVYLDKLHFAAATPYETELQREPQAGKRVLPPEVAQVVRDTLQQVVEQGTARRVSHAFDLADGTPIIIGGKTGTGDHRYKTFAKGGVQTGERVVSRAGAFAFYLGDRYFGTMVAYVAGEKAGNYRFTSALPVQILKNIAPVLNSRLALAESSRLRPTSR